MVAVFDFRKKTEGGWVLGNVFPKNGVWQWGNVAKMLEPRAKISANLVLKIIGGNCF